MQHLQPNTTLQGGKYKIEKVLGQGGFGITYLATQISLNRKVAIKEFFMKDFCSRDEATMMLQAPTSGSNKLVEQYRKKFIKEARNLARLSHPNIINVIDVFEENDTVYYVMPYFAGGSLQDYVKMHGVLSEQEAMNYVKQIASALKYMHEEQHICHYDVKPANILLDDKGNAVLIDFGISKNYDVQGQETTATPVGVSDGYAPTEQYQQNVEEFSPASDVYALGATLYFLLHGKRPVSAVNRASGKALLMNKHFSQRIKDIINASMKISKRERAKSVDVFLGKRNDEDEVTIVDRKVIKDKTVTYPSQTYDKSAGRKENKSYIKLIAAIVVIAGIIGVVLLSLNRYSSQTSKEGIDTAAIDTIDKKQIFIRGKLNNNIAFIMNLTINGNVVEGTEHYDNQSKDAIVLIKGTLEDNGTLTLYEYDKNVKTGTYKGLLSSESYSGRFTNVKGKMYNFTSNVIVGSTSDYIETLEETSIDDEFAFDPWSGKLIIQGAIYRGSDSYSVLTIRKKENNLFVGTIDFALGYIDDSERFFTNNGTLTGKIRAKASGNQLTVVLDEFQVEDPNGAIAYGELQAGQQIFRIMYNNGDYSVEPVGNMGNFYEGMTENTVIKI